MPDNELLPAEHCCSMVDSMPGRLTALFAFHLEFSLDEDLFVLTDSASGAVVPPWILSRPELREIIERHVTAQAATIAEQLLAATFDREGLL